MSWQKLGRIFNPTDYPWLKSHAQVPTALTLPDRIRVYYAARDSDGKSYPCFFDTDIKDPTKLIYVHEQPVMSRGRPGTFDEDGVMPAYIYQEKERIVLYYSGWNAKISTPYHNATGLAESFDKGNSFKRVYEGPVMDRTPTEPYLAVTPCILREKHLYKCWYISGIRWDWVDTRYEPVYGIKYATSKDGINWQRPAELCIPQRHPQEAFSHPSVIKTSDGYHMWYCYRDSKDYRGGQGSYRIGYALSPDGINWKRKDEASGIDVSDDGWDSEMICYPYVVTIGQNRYMYYNGNHFGTTGIGLAKWVET